ncbi:receptor-like protein 7 [Magnolia sinica]|uniref:receptor-like protein 7 n=1 Tax=Magnolia sinica TaxID=86752 RepID=UPI00265A5B0A|nr:receptor-like protein 7 [Magnolia sinica]
MALISSKNPSFLIFFVILFSFLLPSSVFATTQKCIQEHFSALLHLKNGFHFSSYSLSTLSSWNSNNTDCCSWEGITCDGATGHVVTLDLSRLGISGRIDSESLFRLRSLQTLNLAYNAFAASPIPPGFDQLTSLTHLNLSSLRFYGQIPLEISRLTSLVSLDLSYTYYRNDSRILPLKLENPNIGILVQNLSSLRELYLFRINISVQGSEWGPALFLSLPRLRKLRLLACDLSGSIYSPLSQLHFLSELDLSYNNLSSAVPSFPGSLRKLILRACGLSGSIYSSLSQLHFLSELDLLGNNLSSTVPSFPGSLRKLILYNCGLSGSIYSSLSQLHFLSELDLGQNNLSSVLPNFIGNFSSVTVLGLENCSLSGSLPSFLVNLSKLEHLDLSFNSFSGPIPSSYGNQLLNLKKIILWNNLLNGTIPSSLFSLPSLQYLDLEGNKLGGRLDIIYNASSTQLEVIFLNRNNFQGMVPSFIFKFMKLRIIYLSFNNFSGVVELESFQKFVNLSSLDLSENNLSVKDGGGNSNFISFPQIRSLSLRSCNISKFPNFLRNQDMMGELDLSNNRISGEIPKWIWKVGSGTLVYLNLSRNALQRIEPPFLHVSFSDRVALDLSFNKLEGSLPIPPPSTSFFSLSNNSFSGEIPVSICNTTSLEALDLSRNRFSGWIPQCLGEVSDGLKVLNLQGNAFSGTLLQTFKKGCNLQTVDLSENQLEGQVPRSLANCTMLEVLNLGNNQISDAFPSWVEALSQLRVLVLKSNKFHGRIILPQSNQSFPMLQIIDLSSNRFTGVLPSNIFLSWKAMIVEDKSQSKFLGRSLNSSRGEVYYQDTVTVVIKGLERELTKILTIFTAIDLSNNSFQGDIPESIRILKSLRLLNLSGNGFTGQIPTSLENLRVLESLDLSRNNISGEIPWQLTKLTFLSMLNLSQNQLVGSIPQIKQFSTFTDNSFEGNLGLCGPPLLRKCISTPSVMLTFEETASELDWKFMWIGFGVGYGVGMGVLCWTLTLWATGRKEYNKFIDRMFLLIFSSTIFSLKR